MADQKYRGFWDHLNELRRRLIICLVAIAIGIIVSIDFLRSDFCLLLVPAQKINMVLLT